MLFRVFIFDPIEFEAAAADAGVSISAVCREAGRAPSIFVRWKSGKHSPSIKTVQALNDALVALKNGSNGAT